MIYPTELKCSVSTSFGYLKILYFDNLIVQYDRIIPKFCPESQLASVSAEYFGSQHTTLSGVSNVTHYRIIRRLWGRISQVALSMVIKVHVQEIRQWRCRRAHLLGRTLQIVPADFEILGYHASHPILRGMYSEGKILT